MRLFAILHTNDIDSNPIGMGPSSGVWSGTSASN
jgi:hypothetical protein